MLTMAMYISADMIERNSIQGVLDYFQCLGKCIRIWQVNMKEFYLLLYAIALRTLSLSTM